jgi:hypothetical protein
MPNFGGLTIGMNLLKIDFYLEFIGWIHVESGFIVASQGTWQIQKREFRKCFCHYLDFALGNVI